jgi:hypothetical protein
MSFYAGPIMAHVLLTCASYLQSIDIHNTIILLICFIIRKYKFLEQYKNGTSQEAIAKREIQERA